MLICFPVTGVPEDFFDSDKTSSAPQEGESIYNEKPPKPKHPPKANTTEALPEGFFDDPVADAKVKYNMLIEFSFLFICFMYHHMDKCYKTCLQKTLLNACTINTVSSVEFTRFIDILSCKKKS